MGSPETGAGRIEDEGPRHLVTIHFGFWMTDTPVRQCLWQAVTGDNPGKFKSPGCPVENNDWEMTQQFLLRLNDQIWPAPHRGTKTQRGFTGRTKGRPLRQAWRRADPFEILRRQNLTNNTGKIASCILAGLTYPLEWAVGHLATVMAGTGEKGAHGRAIAAYMSTSRTTKT